MDSIAKRSREKQIEGSNIRQQLHQRTANNGSSSSNVLPATTSLPTRTKNAKRVPTKAFPIMLAFLVFWYHQHNCCDLKDYSLDKPLRKTPEDPAKSYEQPVSKSRSDHAFTDQHHDVELLAQLARQHHNRLPDDNADSVPSHAENKIGVDGGNKDQDHQDQTAPVVVKPKYWCCHLQYHGNIGHAVTEMSIDMHSCGPAVSFLYSFWKKDNPVKSQVKQISDLFNTQMMQVKPCIEYYYNNPDKHPKTGRLQAYSQMKSGIEIEKNWYDAKETSTSLRLGQHKILTDCGFKAKQFKKVTDGDEDPYESIEDRPPSRSVMLVLRNPMRKLLNIQTLYNMCLEMGLDCRIFEPSKFFSEPPEDGTYLCNALREFGRDDPVIIGVQGAEMVYPLLLGHRLFLLSTAKKNTRTGCRIGNTTIAEDETQLAPNLICRLSSGIDPFFMEFAFHYGARITTIASHVDLDSLVAQKNATKRQCINLPSYCADKHADVEHVKEKLGELINTGQLLPKAKLS